MSEQPHHLRPISSKKFIVHHAGIEFLEPLTKPEWLDLVSEIYGQWRSSNFRMADALMHGVQQWGEKYALGQMLFRREYQTLANIVSIAKRVPFSRRRENLTFSHHEVVAALPEPDQAKFLEVAERDNLTVSDLRMVVRKELQSEQTLEISEPIDRSSNLLAWFGDGMRFVAGSSDWPEEKRKAFSVQWSDLAEAVKMAKLS